MCLQLCANHPSLQTVDHRFYKQEWNATPFTQKLRKKAKHVPVYTHEDWAQLIRDSRTTPRPFIVKNVMFNDFWDFKMTAGNFNFSKMPWRRVCGLHYIKGPHSNKVFYKTDYAEEFIEADCSKSVKSRGRLKQALLRKIYENSLPINGAKWKDLEKMCADFTIPKIYITVFIRF